MEEWADLSLRVDNSMDFLKGLIKALIELGCVDEVNINRRANSYDELKDYIKDATVTGDILSVAKLYGKASKAIIVIDDDTVTTDGFRLFADIAVITGKIAKPHRGIIIVRSECNTQGFTDLEIKTPGKHIIEQINCGKIKAAIIIGEDVAGADINTARALEKLNFMAVFDVFMTETARMANVVIPIGTFAESEGTFTRSDRKIQSINRAITPVIERTTFEILARLAQYLGLDIRNIKQVAEMISNEVLAYSGFHAARMKGEEIYIPSTRDNIHGEQTMYTDGFSKEDGRAHLLIPVNGNMFREKRIYDTIYRRFEAEMQQNNLKI
jgi:formate dehydrogenase major subunit